MNNKVSVIMGIYNCEETLESAVNSIIAQTYTNWELIMCDDGSTDNTYNVAKKLSEKDERIILIKNEKNQGLNITLNNCLSLATGKYVARMDGDDDCVNYRFEKQVAFLDSQNEYKIVSSGMAFFDENGEWGKEIKPEYPTKEQVVCGSVICHAPVMMHKECYDRVNGYTVSKGTLRVEDVDLWIKLYAAGYKCYSFPECFYRMRNDRNALSRRKYKFRVNSTMVRLKGCKKLNLGFLCKLKCFSPMIIGLVPANLRFFLKKAFQKG